MVTSPINPMRYWKLEEIQRMLNAVEGYENVVIEFQCQQADGWNKLNWDCKYGIKEQLVNGQWNWLLKHTFVVEAKTELDAHNLAWQLAAERLVTDVWRTSINSFRKEQQQRMANKSQSKLNKELVDKLSIYRKPLPRKVMEDILKNANESTYEYAQPLSTDTPNKINTTPPEIFKSQTYNTNEMNITNTTDKMYTATNTTDDTTQVKHKRVWVEVKSTLVTLMIVALITTLVYTTTYYADIVLTMMVCLLTAVGLWGIKEHVRLTLFSNE